MRTLAIAAVALFILAVGSQLYFLQQHQSVSLLHLLLAQPLPQQAAWFAILAAPLLLLFATLWGHERMLQQRKLSEALSAQMRRIREELAEGQRHKKTTRMRSAISRTVIRKPASASCSGG